METNQDGAAEAKKRKGGSSHVKYAIAVVAAAVLIGAIYFANVYGSAQVVAVGDTINVSYTGTFTNGTEFGTNVGGTPLQFTVGSANMIKGFSQAVVGMRVGENRTVTLTPNVAYGYVNQSLFVQVPTNILKNTTLQVGMGIVRMVGSQQEEGTVTAINGSNATIDFNPPLAGKTLVFSIKVLSIQK